MRKTGIISIITFVILQIFVQATFKWGSLEQSNWLSGYIAANIISLISTYFMMIAYKHLNPNVAYGIAISSVFILSQIALSILFKSALSSFQWIILSAIAIAMVFFPITGSIHSNKE